MFAICAGTEWGTLPVVGGIYDQRPEFVDGLSIMFQAQGEQRKREEQRRKRKGK